MEVQLITVPLKFIFGGQTNQTDRLVMLSILGWQATRPDGPPTAREIADMAGVSMSTVKRAQKSLRAAGLIDMSNRSTGLVL